MAANEAPLSAAGAVPRPKGVVALQVAWAGGILFFPALGLRSLLAGADLPPLTVPLTLAGLIMTLLLAKGSQWALPLQILLLLPTLLFFPFTLAAIILLGYMTRPETVSYFKGRVEGPRWDSARTWTRSEWPWLFALGFVFALCVVLLAALDRILPRL